MRVATQGPEHHFVHRIGWLRAAVLGANDGIVSTASLIVGVPLLWAWPPFYVLGPSPWAAVLRALPVLGLFAERSAIASGAGILPAKRHGTSRSRAAYAA